MSTLAVASRPTLLSSWQARPRNDLAAHVAHYGPLPRLDDEFARWLVADVDEASLTGRGGAGFPTAVKLAGHRTTRTNRTNRTNRAHGSYRRSGPGAASLLRQASAGRRAPTLVVNAMEGEPASAKDESLLTCVPHLVLDGAQVAAAAIGARTVVVCVADDRDDLARSVTRAVAERSRAAVDTVEVVVERPPAGYVAGEESALVGWLDSGRGVPTFRPERGVPLRLGGRRALVHNAETVAHLGLLARGAPAGTTLVTVSGSLTAPGVLEVPVGTPLADVVAAGRPTGSPMAALVGGYGGTWLEAARFATPFDAAALGRLGAHPGAGVVVVLSTEACGLAETARIARYMAGESAGQCGPCVYGLPAVAGDLDLLVAGRADRALLPRLTGRLAMVTGRGACRHPDGVARMVASALAVFDADVVAHAAGRPCRYARRPSVLPVAPRARRSRAR